LIAPRLIDELWESMSSANKGNRMQTETLVAFVVAATVIILVPGPTNLAIVSDSVGAGLRKSLWTVSGAALSHAGFITLATAGVVSVLSTYPKFFLFIKWFGVLYLSFQGARLLLVKSNLLEAQEADGNGKASALYLLKGFLVNSTNPKALLFYAALFPPFVNTKTAYAPQLVILSITFLGIFVVVGVGHALLGQKAQDILKNRRNIGIGNKVSGTVMIGAAVWMATK
jgi:homoserine/homoserine lactone efflux protein